VLVLLAEGFQTRLAKVGCREKTLNVHDAMVVAGLVRVVIGFHQIEVQLLPSVVFSTYSYKFVPEMGADHQDVYTQKLFEEGQIIHGSGTVDGDACSSTQGVGQVSLFMVHLTPWLLSHIHGKPFGNFFMSQDEVHRTLLGFLSHEVDPVFLRDHVGLAESHGECTCHAKSISIKDLHQTAFGMYAIIGTSQVGQINLLAFTSRFSNRANGNLHRAFDG
jgi:hypothetical protein